MLAKRIIPCLDVTEGRVVKGVKFVELKDAGDPVELAAYYDKEGADELVFLDITASSDKRYIMLEVVKKVAERVFIPFTVGGGIGDIETMREILAGGADKVSVNTAAVRDPSLIEKGAEKFGSQCIVLAIDAKKVQSPKSNVNKWEVYTHGGRTPTGLDAVEWAKKGIAVILVREETNPEDIEGMRAAQAILTGRGGMTSHAALVARGWGKCCIVGAGSVKINYNEKYFTVGNYTVREGEWLTLNGSKGTVYLGELPMIKAAEENPDFQAFMKICDAVRKLKVRTNADTPEDAARARAFGAEGIGLFRTEHMFYGKNSEEPLFKLRKMIHSNTEAERRGALNELFPFVKHDVKGTMEAMDGYPVTFRTLDPPLHEFVPTRQDEREKLAKSLSISLQELNKRADSLHENNPMMGHRGVRLGITYPEITEMQVRAIFEATAELLHEGKKPFPEIMIPVTCDVNEIKHQYKIITKVHQEVCDKFGLKKIPHLTGTMIEIPRACLTANKIAEVAQFFSFGTNDLTQMGFGFSRDDIGGFLPEYLEQKILPVDPFQTIDQEAIGKLMMMAVEGGRSTRPDLKIGICGEHGGEPKSVEFCHKIGLNYVSCSPFRVPIARLAAAHAVVKESKNVKPTVKKAVVKKSNKKKVKRTTKKK